MLLVLFINTLRRAATQNSLIKPDENMTASRPDRVVASLESHESENAESRVFPTTNRSFCSSFRYCTVRCFYCLGEVDYHHSMGTWPWRYFNSFAICCRISIKRSEMRIQISNIVAMVLAGTIA